MADVPEELLQSFNKIHWGDIDRQLQKREDVQLLYRQVRYLRVFRKAAPFARETVDECTHKLECGSNDQPDLLPIVQSFLYNKVLGRTVTGMASRGTIHLPELSEDETQQEALIMHYENSVGPLLGVKGEYLLDFPDRRVGLPFGDPGDKETMHRLAHLFSFPQQKTLLKCFKAVSEELLRDIELANQLVESLEPFVFKSSRWLVNVELTNAGHSPVALSSNALLWATCGSKKYDPIEMVYRADVQVSAAVEGADDSAKKSQAEKDIKAFGVALDPAEEIGTQNVVVAPGESRSIFLVAKGAIQSYPDSEELLSFWQKRMPEYKVAMELIPKSMIHGPYIRSHWVRV